MIDIINEYDIPRDDIECYNKYPRHNWVYNTTRLLDAQKIHWGLIYTPELNHIMPNKLLGQELVDIQCVEGNRTGLMEPGIYISKPEGQRVFTDVIIQKGDIKWMKSHHGLFIDENYGDVDLRIQAFVVLYFKKFNGCISFETIGNEIYACHLCPTITMVESYPDEAKMLLKKIFNKRKISEMDTNHGHYVFR